jgi:hypothetical protein
VNLSYGILLPFFLDPLSKVPSFLGDYMCDTLSRRETHNFTTEEREVQQLVASKY